MIISKFIVHVVGNGSRLVASNREQHVAQRWRERLDEQRRYTTELIGSLVTRTHRHQFVAEMKADVCQIRYEIVA
jgi:uncharacterized pyridoxal phosphate-containing UPF0001 family protein